MTWRGEISIDRRPAIATARSSSVIAVPTMGFAGWIKTIFGRAGQPVAMVPFYDTSSHRVVRIPATELRPGCVQARIHGIDGIVWLLPDQLHQGEIRHPPFDEGLRSYIRQIQTAFAEHRALSFEEWEDGFRRDTNAAQEIALWSHAANIYHAFASGESRVERRRDIYRVIVACLTASPDSVWHVIQLQALSRAEAEKLVSRFYGPGAGTSTV